jgi:hypothetical protein
MAEEIVIKTVLRIDQKELQQDVSKALSSPEIENAGRKAGKKFSDGLGLGIEAGRRSREDKELAHQRKLEAIAAQSGARLEQIEARRASQINLIRERAAQQEISRLKRLEGQAQASARSIQNAFRAIGGILPGVGVAAFGGAAISKAFDFDNTRVQLAAFVGGLDNANRKLAELSKVAQSTAGVTRGSLVAAFIDLKAQAKLSDEQATKLSVSIAKLQALFPKAQNTAQNLAQIFNQSFELQDIKQERGQTGDFIDSVIKRLGFDGPKAIELIRKAKEAGKLTQKSFFDAVDAEVVSRSANLTETLQIRMVKALEATNEKMAELGDKLLKSVIPALDKLLPPLNSVLDVFNKLPDAAKAATIGILLVAPAIGTLANAVIGLKGAMIALGGFLTSPAGIAALGLVGLATAGFALHDLIQNKIPANVANALKLGDRSLLNPEGQPNLGGVGNIPGFRLEGNKFVREKKTGGTSLTGDGTGKSRAENEARKAQLELSRLSRAALTLDLEGKEARAEQLREGRQTRAELTADLAKSEREAQLAQGRLARAALTEDFEKREELIKKQAEAQEKFNEELKEANKLAQEMDPNFRFMKGLRGETDAVASSFERLGQNIGNAFGDVRNLISSLGAAVKQFFGDILSATIRTATASVLGPLFGGAGGGGLGNLFRTPSFAGGGGITAPPSISSSGPRFGELLLDEPFASAATQQQSSGIFGKIPGLNKIFGGIFNKVFAGGAVSAIPPLLGAQLGAGLGGKSVLGNILGGIGGGAVGLGAAFGASVFSAGGGLAAAGLAALGPAALIGAPLLVGAILLGKAAQRRKDEDASGQLLTQAQEAIQQLAAGIASDQIDGSQARSIFDSQILAQFKAGIGQLKTKSVRESRLTNQVRDLEKVYNDVITPQVTAQQQRRADAVAKQERLDKAALVFSRQIPEFAIGGTARGGLALVHEGEKILNLQQQSAVRAMAGPDVFERAGVPGPQQSRVFDNGGTVSSGSMPIVIENLNVTVLAGKDDQTRVFVTGGNTPQGQAVIVKNINNARREKHL